MQELEVRNLGLTYTRVCRTNLLNIVTFEEILEGVRRGIHNNKRCGCEVSVLERIMRNLFLKCFEHVERMREERLVKRVYRANVEGNRGRGRPQRRWWGKKTKKENIHTITPHPTIIPIKKSRLVIY